MVPAYSAATAVISTPNISALMAMTAQKAARKPRDSPLNRDSRAQQSAIRCSSRWLVGDPRSRREAWRDHGMAATETPLFFGLSTAATRSSRRI